MADAAHAVLTRVAQQCTGNFFIDEQVLREAGITDFGPYREKSVSDADLVSDFFV
jgi:citronellol/citronellal dehydrogenase